MQATVDGVFLAQPGSAQPARFGMHLEDAGTVVIHLAVAAG